MSWNRCDLTGQRFGRLTVVKDSGERRHGNVVWECVCDCGTHYKVKGGDLKTGNTKSCGCLHRESASNRCKARVTHGMSSERIYSIWNTMVKRCYNKNFRQYKDYGGRGIFVCDEWKNDVIAFKEWAIAHGYDDTLSIERVDVNKGYSPDNCTWIPRNMQAYNRRCTLRYNGKSLRLWAKELGLKPETVLARIYELNWPVEEALELKEHVFSRERYEASRQYENSKRQREKTNIAQQGT